MLSGCCSTPGARAAPPERLDDALARAEGITGSLLEELLRRAALPAATRTEDADVAVSADHLDAALDELLDTRNAMTRTVLGSTPS